MARPWRRVLIGLSIRIGVSLRELELLDIATIRQYLAMLNEINKPDKPGVPDVKQSPDEIAANFAAAFARTKE